jgi:hypothetical protein
MAWKEQFFEAKAIAFAEPSSLHQLKSGFAFVCMQFTLLINLATLNCGNNSFSIMVFDVCNLTLNL